MTFDNISNKEIPLNIKEVSKGFDDLFRNPDNMEALKLLLSGLEE